MYCVSVQASTETLYIETGIPKMCSLYGRNDGLLSGNRWGIEWYFGTFLSSCIAALGKWRTPEILNFGLIPMLGRYYLNAALIKTRLTSPWSRYSY